MTLVRAQNRDTVPLSGDSKFSCLSNVSYVVDLSRVTKRRARSVIKMQCNENTIYVCPQFKRQHFLQTIENSNLLTNFTTDFTR